MMLRLPLLWPLASRSGSHNDGDSERAVPFSSLYRGPDAQRCALHPCPAEQRILVEVSLLLSVLFSSIAHISFTSSRFGPWNLRGSAAAGSLPHVRNFPIVSGSVKAPGADPSLSKEDGRFLRRTLTCVLSRTYPASSMRLVKTADSLRLVNWQSSVSHR